MRESQIFITEPDAARLRGLLAGRAGDSRDQEHLDELASELERANVVAANAVPPGVVALHSQVRVVDLATGERQQLTLVFPWEASPLAGRVSVLAPLGCALMGYREGDVVDWLMPGGPRRLRIEEVQAPEGNPDRIHLAVVEGT